MGCQWCSAFMVSGGLPSMTGNGDGREKKREKALFENVGREKMKERVTHFFKICIYIN